MQKSKQSKLVRQRKLQVDKAITEWGQTLGKALIWVTNQNRHQAGIPPLPPNTEVCISRDLKLLNLKVWTMRYSVNLEFILKTLLDRYAKYRKVPDTNILTLGLAPAMLCGPTSREAIETAIAEAFPDGENERLARQEAAHKPPLIRPQSQAKTLDAMVKKYGKVIQRRRAEISRTRRLKRPFRNNPFITT